MFPTLDFPPADSGPQQVPFLYFPYLALEIRELIWEHCIPSRLIVGNTSELAVVRSEEQPPFVSQVCKEARIVALRNAFRIRTVRRCYREFLRDNARLFRLFGLFGRFGRFEITPALQPFDAISQGPSYRERLTGVFTTDLVWFDPTRDTIWLDTWAYSINGGPDSIMGLGIALLDQIQNDRRRRSSPYVAGPPQAGFQISDYPERNSCAAFKNLYRTLGPPPAQPADSHQLLVVHNYTIRATLSRALESELFGLWCENWSILVDVGDADKICKLLNLDTWEPPYPLHASISGTKTAEVLCKEAQLQTFHSSNEFEYEDTDF